MFLTDGNEFSGKIALFGEVNDWKFVKRFMFFILESSPEDNAKA